MAVAFDSYTIQTATTQIGPWNIDAGTNENRGMLAFFVGDFTVGSGTPTYDSVPLKILASHGSGTGVNVISFYLENPSAGVNEFNWGTGFSATTKPFTIIFFSGVHQQQMIGASNVQDFASFRTNFSGDITTQYSDSMVFDMFQGSNELRTSIAPGSGTERFDQQVTWFVAGATRTVASPGTQTLSWSWTNDTNFQCTERIEIRAAGAPKIMFY